MARNVPFWGTVVLLGTPTLGAMYLGQCSHAPHASFATSPEFSFMQFQLDELPILVMLCPLEDQLFTLALC